MNRVHSMFYEGQRDQFTDTENTQNHLSNKAVDIYAVRGRAQTTPGESRTSPTLESSFDAGDDLHSDVFDSLVAPLPDVGNNNQDAVHRSNHPAGSNGGHSRHSIPTAHQRIIGAGGTSAQQTIQRQAEWNPVSHPMAGGSIPERINLKQAAEEGHISYFPMSSGQASSKDPRVTPANHKKFRDEHLRKTLNHRPSITGQSRTH